MLMIDFSARSPRCQKDNMVEIFSAKASSSPPREFNSFNRQAPEGIKILGIFIGQNYLLS